VRRGAARAGGFAAALLMVALIAGISLTGRWPKDSPLERPAARGVLALAPDRVARIEISAGEKDIVFEHRPTGGWLVNGGETEKAVSEHIDTALRLLNVSNPTRVLKAGEYDAAQVAEFGLDPPRMLVSIVSQGGKTSSVSFGETTPGQNAQYARVIGQPNLYLLSRYVGVEWQLAADMAERVTPGEAAAPAGTGRPGTLLLPVSLVEIAAVEIVANGALTRFERDQAGNWFHHVGQHAHAPGGVVHQADPKLAPLLAAELAALERAPIEGVVARHADAETLGSFGLEHPPLIMLLYTRDSSRPVARIEFGRPAEDNFGRYARVQETDTVVTVAGFEASHVSKLLQLAGARS
jgi:hypothetical protein